MRGSFIVFESIDGGGKDTQIELLELRMDMNNIKSDNIKYHFTREPSSNYIGSLIRSEYLSGKSKIDSKVLTLLFAADRLDHITNPDNGIIKYLDDGINVISNRYYLSSLAYDGSFNDFEFVLDANKVNIDSLKPDLTIYIDLDPDIAIERINAGRNGREIYETFEKLVKVRDKYLLLTKELIDKGESIVLINGNDTIENVSFKIWKAIKPILYKNKTIGEE